MNALQFARAHILTGKRNRRLVEGVHREIGKILNIGGGRAACHHVLTKAVDGCLDDDVGQCEQDTLKACRQTDFQDSQHFIFVNPQQLEVQTERSLLFDQTTQNHKGRKALRNRGCRRDTSDVKLQNNDEEKIQYDIDDSGDRQIIQRAFGISFGAQYRAAEVVDHHGRHAEKIDPHVQGGKRQNLLRRLHQFQNRRRDHNADDPHRDTRYDAQRDRGMYGLADIAFLARALISGRQYIAADSQPDKKINQKVNQG